MKRIFALILALCMTFSLFACGKKQADPTPGSQSSANTGTADPGQGGGSAAPTDPGTGGSGSGSGSGDPSGTGSTGSGWAGTRVAVIYFSCTGNTRTAAERIRDLTGADLIELVPEQPIPARIWTTTTRAARAIRSKRTPRPGPDRGPSRWTCPSMAPSIWAIPSGRAPHHGSSTRSWTAMT